MGKNKLWVVSTTPHMCETDTIPHVNISVGSGWNADITQYFNLTGIGTESDARLISAAPDLLEALWNLSQRVAEQGGDTAEADRAIAKAKGEPS